MKKSLICPCCGAEITNIDKKKAKVQCEYCGSMVENEVYVENKRKEEAEKSKTPIADYIIPFTETADGVKERLIHCLITEDNVPTDVFENINIKDITKSYRKAWFFAGQFDASWSCTQIIEVERSRKVYDRDGNPKTEYYRENEYHPASGMAKGTFDFLAGKDFCRMDEGFPTQAKPFSYDLLDSTVSVLGADLTEESRWKKLGEIIELLAKKACVEHAPRYYEDFTYSYTHSQTAQPKSVLVACWDVTFDYKGTSYHTLLTNGETDFNVPKDKDEDEEYEELKEQLLQKKEGCGFVALIVLGAMSVFVCGINAVMCMDNTYTKTAVIVGGIILAIFYIKRCIRYSAAINQYNKQVEPYNENIEQLDDDTKIIAMQQRARSAASVFGVSIDEYEKEKVSGVEKMQKPVFTVSFGKEFVVILIATILYFIVAMFIGNIGLQRERQQLLETPFYKHQTDLQCTGFPSGTRQIVKRGDGENIEVWTFTEAGELCEFRERKGDEGKRLVFESGKCTRYEEIAMPYNGRYKTDVCEITYINNGTGTKVMKDGELYSTVYHDEKGRIRDINKGIIYISSQFGYTEGGNLLIDERFAIEALAVFGCPQIYADGGDVKIYTFSDTESAADFHTPHYSDIENIGFSRDIKQIIVASYDTIFYDFNNQGNLAKITIQHAIYSEIYTFSNGRITTMDELYTSKGDDSYYSSYNEDKHYTYEYREKQHKLVDNGQTTTNVEIEVYKISETEECMMKTLEYDEKRRLIKEGLIYDDGGNAIAEEYGNKKPTISAIELFNLRNCAIAMPVEYEILEGTAERPLKIKSGRKEITMVYR